MKRKNFCVLGSSCAGKSTLSKRIALELDLRPIELDALFWLPGWREEALETFRAKVEQATRVDGWVADGNYSSKLKDILWARADVFIWLDPPLALVLWRFFLRTIRRSRAGGEIWPGCKETLRHSLFRKNSLLVWILRTFWRRKREAKTLQNSMNKSVVFIPVSGWYSTQSAWGLIHTRLRQDLEA